jgi:acetyl coenzyme A synthetase (ADP forming)-like protein
MRQALHHSFVPTQESPATGRIILRDGGTAHLRPAFPADRAILERFFATLPDQLQSTRIFSDGATLPEIITQRCDNSNPAQRLTLVVTRRKGGETSIVALASYHAIDERTAEVAFLVDDDFQGKGLGTLLLERLALLAVAQGFTHFWAVTRSDNEPMRNLFRDSGFDLVEQPHRGEPGVILSLRPTADTISRLSLRDRLATVASIRPFFQPRGVAVVGASRNPDNIGHKVLHGLIESGFPGPIYPINPKADEILGVKAYPSLRDVPGEVDLAVMAVPPRVILTAVDDAATAGVRALVVITAGFAEVRDPDGRDLQSELVEKVRGHGMRMIGPNCLGVLNTDPQRRLNASFSPIFPPPGRIAMSSQSGALGLAVLAAAQRLHLGLSTFVSVGNKADVSGNDLLQYWEEDPQTDVILLYLESFGNPRRFAHIAGRVSRSKPILAIKAGRGKAGARAASSHTAALASREVAVDALFRQTGVIRLETLEEMFDLANAFANQPLPQGKRVAILTNAGGPGILCADMCESAGLDLDVLSPATQAALQAFLPSTASVSNPVDMVASAPPVQYRQALEVLMACDDIDAIIVIYIPVGFGENQAYFDAIHDGYRAGKAKGPTKTVLGCWMSANDANAGAHERLPAYAFPEAPARVLGRMSDYAAWRTRPDAFIPELDHLRVDDARRLCEDSLAKYGAGWLTLPECFELLDAFGLPVAKHGLARDADEAVAWADKLGYPVVLKLSPRQLVHKTELGGVRLNLGDAASVSAAYRTMAEAWDKHAPGQPLEGILVQTMIKGGTEVMSGMTRDPLFGPLLAFGLGGVMVEALGDVCFRVAPLTVADAREMLRTPKGSKLLRGFRGNPPCDLAAVEDAILRLARLAEELPQVQELDFNPILVFPEGKGCLLIDARIRLAPTR